MNDMDSLYMSMSKACRLFAHAHGHVHVQQENTVNELLQEKEELAEIAKQKKLATQRIKVKANVAMLKAKGIFWRKKRLGGKEREKQANATKTDLPKLADRVVAELASLRDKV